MVEIDGKSCGFEAIGCVCWNDDARGVLVIFAPNGCSPLFVECISGNDYWAKPGIVLGTILYFLLDTDVETCYQTELFAELKLTIKIVEIAHSSGAIGVVGAHEGAPV